MVLNSAGERHYRQVCTNRCMDTKASRGAVTTPLYVGMVNELEWVDDAPWCDLPVYFNVYGVGDHSSVMVDRCEIIIDNEELEIYGSEFFDGFHDMFVVRDGDELVLTTEKPPEFEFERPNTEVVTVVDDPVSGQQYIKLDGEWFESYDAGTAYMEHRNGNATVAEEPHSSLERLEVTLYNAHSGGGSFWAACNGRAGSGDMPEEALSNAVYWAVEELDVQ